LTPNCQRISPNDQTVMPMTGIVDKDVDRSDLAFDPVDDRLDRHLVRDIEENAMRPARRDCLESDPFVFVAKRFDDDAAGCEGGLPTNRR
jgi:hypothetical protein